MTETALIAALMPGLGNPQDLPVEVFDAMVARVGFVQQVRLGALDEKEVMKIEAFGFGDT